MDQIFTMDVEREIKPALHCARLLHSNGLVGEFYITGAMVERYPKECRELSRHHVVGGHGYHHENFSKLSVAKQKAVLEKVMAIFRSHQIPITGWRFPGVNFTNQSLHLIADNKLFDSSLRENVWKRYGRGNFLRNWLKNIHNGIWSFPKAFPHHLIEKPWSHADLEDGQFFTKKGRLMMHCWKYNQYRKELAQWIVSQ